MQNSSAFQFLALDTIHESAANPRRTFEESKLHELADFVPGNKTRPFVALIVLLPRTPKSARKQTVHVPKGT